MSPRAAHNGWTSTADEFDDLLTTVHGMLSRYLRESEAGAPVVTPEATDPIRLASKLQSLHLPDQAEGKHGVLPLIEDTLKYSVRTWIPRFMDKLYAGANPIGVIAELITAVLNTNVHVFHVSPVFTLQEIKVMQTLSEMLGFRDGGGVLCPGGSYSNLTAIVTARNILFPYMKTDGLLAPPPVSLDMLSPRARAYPYHHLKGPLVVFASMHCHYSIHKSAMAAGIGLKHVRGTPVDHAGRMDPVALEQAIEQAIRDGERPFVVCATAGTTVLGAFDPVDKIAAVCKKYGLWLHVDGSWGGAVMFSDTLKAKLLRGIEEADSVTMNPHKMLGVPLICSALITKEKLVLVEANHVKASYLFHEENESSDVLDLAEGTLGCGRRSDVLKFVLSWVYYGKDGFAKRVELAMQNAEYLKRCIEERQLKATGGWELVFGETDYSNVCFYYYPPVKGVDTLKYYQQLRVKDPELYSKTVERITKSIHAELTRRGRFMVDYSPIEMPAGFQVGQTSLSKVSNNGVVRLPPFWRAILNNPDITHEDLNGLLDEIEGIGCTLFKQE